MRLFLTAVIGLGKDDSISFSDLVTRSYSSKRHFGAAYRVLLLAG